MNPDSPALPSAAVFGLGIIGSRVHRRLCDAGLDAACWSRRPRAGLTGWHDDPAAAARSARFLQLFVADGPAVHAVLEAIAPALRPDHTVIVHATIAPAEMRAAAARVADHGAAFLEAPFTGSRDAAAAGRLVYYVAGESATLAQARPLLELSSREILPFGAIGEATVIKIATNMVTASIVEALAEALAVIRTAGLDPADFRRAVDANACRSGTSDFKLPAMIAGDTTPHFALRHMLKDARLALALASAAGLALPALAETAAAMERLAANHADEDFSVVARQWDARPRTRG
jgi:3-hydroxyisobutyrate dehydrogenase-like beta-hydroxyacid dehydrogenase